MNDDPHRFRPSETGFQIIPVLDLQAGQVVHARGGDRAAYRPLVSRLTPGSDPATLARVLRDHVGPCTLYVADLDAITNAPPQRAALGAIAALGIELLADLGIRDESDAAEWSAFPPGRLVAGSETIRGCDALRRVVACLGPDRVVFSLDLREDRVLLASPEGWSDVDPESVLEDALAVGIRRFILLDLARVGTGAGSGTDRLVRQMARDRERVEILVGGGIGTVAELRRVRDMGAHGALIATALHDGRLTKDDLDEFLG